MVQNSGVRGFLQNLMVNPSQDMHCNGLGITISR